MCSHFYVEVFGKIRCLYIMIVADFKLNHNQIEEFSEDFFMVVISRTMALTIMYMIVASQEMF